MNKIIRLIVAVLCSFATAETFAEYGPLNDAQIADITVTATTVAINRGKLADKKSHNREVRAFAREMVDNHTQLNNQVSALVKKLHLDSGGNDLSVSLKKNDEESLHKLQALNDKAFDRAYVDNEVAFHKTILNNLDNTLIPNAKNAELKHMLRKMRAQTEEHLEAFSSLRVWLSALDNHASRGTARGSKRIQTRVDSSVSPIPVA